MCLFRWQNIAIGPPIPSRFCLKQLVLLTSVNIGFSKMCCTNSRRLDWSVFISYPQRRVSLFFMYFLNLNGTTKIAKHSWVNWIWPPYTCLWRYCSYRVAFLPKIYVKGHLCTILCVLLNYVSFRTFRTFSQVKGAIWTHQCWPISIFLKNLFWYTENKVFSQMKQIA